jgi:hypothetical protein
MKKRLIILLAAGVSFCTVRGRASPDAAEGASQETSAASTTSAATAEDEAFRAQKKLVLDALAARDMVKAEAACQEMLSKFGTHKDIAQAIYDIARKYGEASNAEKTLQLHAYNVEHNPSTKYGLWSQIEIIKMQIAKKDDGAADAACDKLLKVFAAEKSLPHVRACKEIKYTIYASAE